MADEQRANGSGGADGGPVKVNDRRRFTPKAIPSAPQATRPPRTTREQRLQSRRSPTSATRRSRGSKRGSTSSCAPSLRRWRRARPRGAGWSARRRASSSRSARRSRRRSSRRSITSSSRWGRPATPVDPLVDGVRLTLSSLAKKVSELGAERIAVLGHPFDPRVAEAVDSVPVTDPAQDEVVVQEVRAGYRIGDRVLRPARVRVGRLARA